MQAWQTADLRWHASGTRLEFRCACEGVPSLRSVAGRGPPTTPAGAEPGPWRNQHRPDPAARSFQYVDEEGLMNAIKGFSSVTKEHTTFTDTHL